MHIHMVRDGLDRCGFKAGIKIDGDGDVMAGTVIKVADGGVMREASGTESVSTAQPVPWWPTACVPGMYRGPTTMGKTSRILPASQRNGCT